MADAYFAERIAAAGGKVTGQGAQVSDCTRHRTALASERGSTTSSEVSGLGRSRSRSPTGERDGVRRHAGGGAERLNRKMYHILHVCEGTPINNYCAEVSRRACWD